MSTVVTFNFNTYYHEGWAQFFFLESSTFLLWHKEKLNTKNTPNSFQQFPIMPAKFLKQLKSFSNSSKYINYLETFTK